MRWRTDFDFGLARLVLFFVVCSLFALSIRTAVDPDYGWHVVNGANVINGSAFSGRDFYSWTAAGSPWIVHEWVVDAVMAMVHRAGGRTANSFLAAALGTGAFCLVAVRLRRNGIGRAAMLVTVGIAFLSSVMSLGVRPQVLELLYLAGLLLFLDEYRARAFDRRTLWLGVAIGGMVWANTHGSFPVIVAVLGITAFGFALSRDIRTLDVAVATLIAALSTMLNPWGWHVWAFATQSITSKATSQLIQEWRPPNLLSGSLLPFVVALALAVIGAMLALRRGISAQGDDGLLRSPNVSDALIAVAFAFLAVRSGRHVMLFGVAAAPLIASAIQFGIGRLNIHSSRFGWLTTGSRAAVVERDRKIIHLMVSLGVLGYVSWASWQIASPERQTAALSRRYPVGIVESLRGIDKSSMRILNEYSWGGFLIEHGILPVFIDGRSEVYGDRQLQRYSSIVTMAPGWREQIEALRVNLVLMPRASPLADSLVKSGWNEVSADKIGRLLTRPLR